MTPEFSRRIKIEMLGEGGLQQQLTADPDECAALAKRFGLLSLDQLEAQLTICANAKGFLAEGHFEAACQQRCVATDAPVAARLHEAIRVLFVPEADAMVEEVELDADECDEISHDGLALDLGEAVAQSFALALDPYPRAEDAEAYLKSAGVIQEEDASPFAVLKSLFAK